MKFIETVVMLFLFGMMAGFAGNTIKEVNKLVSLQEEFIVLLKRSNEKLNTCNENIIKLNKELARIGE